jgi:hypothetical protein
MLCCSLDKRTWHQLARRDRGAKTSMHCSDPRNPGTVHTFYCTGNRGKERGTRGGDDRTRFSRAVTLLQQKVDRDLFVLIVIVGVTC